jgi:hypothetical protein
MVLMEELPLLILPLLMVFGFNRHKETDLKRVKKFSKSFVVHTVSRSCYDDEKKPKNKGDEAYHHYAYFKDISKGERSTILELVREKVLIHKDVYIHLDYFWAAKNYYKNGYGTLWLEEWVQALLEAGAKEVILPYNDEMEEFEKKKDALVGEHIKKEESFLWRETEAWCVEEGEGLQKGFHQSKMSTLNGATPFVRFTKGIDYICVTT